MNQSIKENDKKEEKGIPEEMVEKTVRELCKLILASNDEDFVYSFFECLFTKPELKDMASRWLLVKEIDKGTTQREIAKAFSMSLCKITRGSRELQKSDSAFRKMLEMSKNL